MPVVFIEENINERLSMPKIKNTIIDVLLALACMSFAFYFSVALPPYIGVFVFVVFFVLGVGLMHKAWIEVRKKH